MFKFLKKYRNQFILIILIFTIYFITRLIHLQLRYLPLFTDEAIYAYWAQRGKFDASWRLASLSDGKQPLFIWLTSLMMNLVSNPVLAGRLVSVISGALTMVGLILLGLEVFKSLWIGLIAALFYVFYPFALVLDRMALYDSLVGTFSVWALYLGILLTRMMRLDIAFILAQVIGASILNKTSGFFNIYLLPITLILFRTKSNLKNNFIKWVFLIFIVILLSLTYYSVLRLSYQFNLISEKNGNFIYTINHLLDSNFIILFAMNLSQFTEWLIIYFSFPIILLIIFSFFTKAFFREKLLLMLWFFVPFLALSAFGRIVYPRYLFFMTLPLLLLTSFSFVSIYKKLNKNNMLIALFVVGIFILNTICIYKIIFNYPKALIPKADKEQYINGIAAGGGIREIISYLIVESSARKIMVVTEGIYGSLTTTSVNMYFLNNPNIEKIVLDQIPTSIPAELLNKSKEMPVYIIFNYLQNVPVWPIELISQSRKGISNYYIRLYKVTRW